MGLAIAIITGLVLNTANIRLTAGSWAIALGLVTAAGLVVKAILEAQHAVEGHSRRRPAWLTATSLGGRGSLELAPDVLFVVSAALATTAAVAIGVLGQRDRDRQTHFTELWALPGRGAASPVRLGVSSHESGDVRYRIRISLDGRVVRSQALMLRPGETWQSTQPVARPGVHVDVALLTSSRGPAYRAAHLTAG
jgi:hypothetical protein